MTIKEYNERRGERLEGRGESPYNTSDAGSAQGLSSSLSQKKKKMGRGGFEPGVMLSEGLFASCTTDNNKYKIKNFLLLLLFI